VSRRSGTTDGPGIGAAWRWVLAQRGTSRELLLAGVFFVVVAYVAFGANVFGGEVVAPMDLLSRFSGYNEGDTALPLVNIQMGDILDSLLPTWRYVKSQIWAGRLPTWLPLAAGGEPSLPLFSAFVSPRFLLFLLLPDGIGYTLGLIVQTAIGGFGTFLLCRRGVGFLPALLGGVTFMLSGFNGVWMQWPHVSTSIWIPWMLWALARLDAEPSGRTIAALAVIVALLLFGGFPAVAGYGFYCAALIGLVLLISRWRRLGARSALGFGSVAALAVGLGVLLTAAQLLPSIEYLHQFDFSGRGHRTGGIGPSYIAALVNPDAFGEQGNEFTAYVGILPLVLAAVVVLALPLGGLPRLPLVLSPGGWLSLLGFAMCVVYGAPEGLAGLLYRLPIFSFNPNGRMASVMGLAFAVLAAIGGEALVALGRGWLGGSAAPRFVRARPPFLLAGALLAHGLDEGRILRAHNARAPGHWFFPERPTLTFVRERLGPDQSVLATTDGYMLPGTLGSYGIPEWFGHAYHRPAEKQALETLMRDPWAPGGTSARVAFDRIDPGSPLLDRLGVRFILVAGGGDPLAQLRMASVEQPLVDTPIELGPEAEELGVGQTFVVPARMSACAVRLRFGTYGKGEAGADVRMTLSGPEGTLASVVMPADEIADNDWVDFAMDPVELEPGEHALRVSLASPLAERLAVWSSRYDGSLPGGARLQGNRAASGDLSFKIIPCAGDPSTGWAVARRGETLVVLENTDATSGAFLVARDAPEGAAPLSGEVKLLTWAGERRRYQVTTAEPSLLVRAVRFWPGFVATVDGKPAAVGPYAALFQSVPVPSGTHVVEVRYVPAEGRRGVAGSALGALGILALAVVGRRKRATPPVLPTPR
jgi:hypothetical protein